MSEPASPSAANHTNGDSAPSVSSAAAAPIASPSRAALGSSPSGKSLPKPAAPAVTASLTRDEKIAKVKAKEAKLKALREQRAAKEKSDRAELEKKEKEERERMRKEHEDKLAKERKQFAAQMKKEAEEEKVKAKVARPESAVSPPVKVGFKIKELTGALKGLKITSLTKDGPAHRAGLEVNDVIKQVNGKMIHSMKDWKTASAAFRPSTSVPFVVLHNGSTVTVIVHFAGVASVNVTNATSSGSGLPTSPTAASAAAAAASPSSP